MRSIFVNIIGFAAAMLILGWFRFILAVENKIHKAVVYFRWCW